MQRQFRLFDFPGRACHDAACLGSDRHPAHRRVHLHRVRCAEFLSADHAGGLGAAQDLDGALGPGSSLRESRPADPGVPGAHAPPHDPRRHLRGGPQAPPAPPVLAHAEAEHVFAASRCGRRGPGGRGLCHVHASALGSRGMEHATARRPLGSDLPECKVHLRPDGMGELRSAAPKRNRSRTSRTASCR